MNICIKVRNSLTKYTFVKILRRFTDYTKVTYHTINRYFNQINQNDSTGALSIQLPLRDID